MVLSALSDSIAEAVAVLTFSNADVEYLLDAKKTISAIPNIMESAAEFVMAANVRRKDNPGKELGLIIRVHAKRSPSGIPKGVPACVLQWHGQRIRGINRELWHDNPDGSIVKGWHEHLWNEEDRDGRVVPADIKRADMRGVFEWCLKKWNIEVRERQSEARDNG